MHTSERKPRTSSPRLSRDEWLARALELLGKKGAGALTLDAIAHHLGVTKGSFYWHFQTRDDFYHQLIEYWGRRYTKTVIDHILSLDVSPEDRLVEVMRLVHSENMDRFEMPVRAWAQQNPKLLPLVRKVDRSRVAFVKALFLEMGFGEDEAELRCQVFVAYMASQRFLVPQMPRNKQLANLGKRAAFFTQRRGK